MVIAKRRQQIQQKKSAPINCFFCGSSSHRSSDCPLYCQILIYLYKTLHSSHYYTEQSPNVALATET
ncbi:hypothetical protein BD408DRAFT_411677 [Parasitella parasitica]|nr:hypothetical protein BD408DRAFT_411677 [Parasitella parasitica]